MGWLYAAGDALFNRSSLHATRTLYSPRGIQPPP